jgi:hypothetical protein
LYLSTGNGNYSPSAHNWGDSVIALHPDGSAANANGDPLDSYTPANFASLESADADLGSTLPAVIPALPNSRIPHVAVMGGKDAQLRLLNMDNLSGHGAPGFTAGEISTINVPQGGQVFSQPAVWTNPQDNSAWVFVATGSGTAGLQVVVDGSGNPALVSKWTIAAAGTSPLVANGVLYLAGGNRVGAYNPTSGALLWQDATLAGGVHWQSPVVANGKLFMQDSSGHLNAYGI